MLLAQKRLDTGQQLYENERKTDGLVSSHMAGQQRDVKEQMAVRGKRATNLAIDKYRGPILACSTSSLPDGQIGSEAL
jgi:hypothetical protein